MRAAVMVGFREPLVVQQLPDPEPGPTDAVVRVYACGICRTDWHVWQGDWGWLGRTPTLPVVPGHELAGVVEAVGEEVRSYRAGDRVTVPFHVACGRCEYCSAGRSNLCLTGGGLGVRRNGGYAEKVLIPEADVNLLRLPENIGFLSAAALGCRYMTAYHGLVDRAQLRPGEWVAIFGVGGVGLSAVQISSALGARPIAVDIREDKLEKARAEGAVAAVNAARGDPVEAIRDLTGGGADITVEALGSEQTTVPAVLALRRGGRHVQIGLTGQKEQGRVSIPVDYLVRHEISFLGSFGCPVASHRGLLNLVAMGRVDPGRLVTRIVSLEESTEVLQAMSEFGTLGFHVIVPGGNP